MLLLHLGMAYMYVHGADYVNKEGHQIFAHCRVASGDHLPPGSVNRCKMEQAKCLSNRDLRFLPLIALLTDRERVREKEQKRQQETICTIPRLAGQILHTEGIPPVRPFTVKYLGDGNTQPGRISVCLLAIIITTVGTNNDVIDLQDNMTNKLEWSIDCKPFSNQSTTHGPIMGLYNSARTIRFSSVGRVHVGLPRYRLLYQVNMKCKSLLAFFGVFTIDAIFLICMETPTILNRWLVDIWALGPVNG